MKHAIRNSSRISRKAIRKAQSVFLQGILYPALEEARQAFASVERTHYMPELIPADEEGINWSVDEDYAQIWEGRA